MPDGIPEFQLPDDTEAGELLHQLQGLGPLREQLTRRVRRLFHDTFDWRVHGAKSRLETVDGGNGTRLRWRHPASGLVLEQTQTSATRFVWDLAPSPLRERLAPILEMRALVPVAAVESVLHPLELLDKNRKTVLRMYLEQHRVGPPGAKVATSLATRVRLSPVKGYRKPLRKAVALLRETLELPAVADDLLDEALAALGRTPGQYSSKLRLQLDPGMPASRAVKNVLLRLLETMQANEAGTLADLDSEFLHDFRVSVRRTRSALSQLKGVLPGEIDQRFRPEFAWLGLITGPTRDLDVYRLKLPAYRAALPPSVRQDLGPLHDFLVAHQRKEQQTLARQLRSQRYRRLVAEWRAVLECSAETEAGPANASRPVKDVASERIWKVFRRAIREGRAIGPGSPAEMLHELRKTCKKLRYLLEFFQSLYPQGQIRQRIKALKVLQDNLGDFQDLEVQSDALTAFSRQMAAEQDVPPETLLAMGMLVEDLRRRQHQVRDEFSARFVAFSSPQNRKLFQELFVLHRAKPERPA